MKNSKTLYLVQLAILVAIELIFCFTPLGSLPLGPGIVATLSHIPVIIGALLLGKLAGVVLGSVFGLSSLAVWTFMTPNPAVAFAFTPAAPNGNFFSLLICILPRALFPLVTTWIFILLKDKLNKASSAAIAAGIGTIVHSILVLTGIYLALNSNPVVGGDYLKFIVAWAGLNAVAEIVIAAALSAAIIVPLGRINTATNMAK
jgi:uncharacterized membrane protein